MDCVNCDFTEKRIDWILNTISTILSSNHSTLNYIFKIAPKIKIITVCTKITAKLQFHYNDLSHAE